MPIRREDKEFIQSLSLLGALLGACVGVFVIVQISNEAQKQHFEKNEYAETHAALLKLSSTAVNPNNPIADKNVLNQVQQQIEQTPVPAEHHSEVSFWSRVPRWGYLGLCGGAGIMGAMGGYYSTWVIGCCGTIFVCYIIRLLYQVVRRVAPSYAATINLQPVSKGGDAAVIQIHREEGRMLPTLVKLLFLITFLLAILAAVVWRVTAI